MTAAAQILPELFYVDWMFICQIWLVLFVGGRVDELQSSPFRCFQRFPVKTSRAVVGKQRLSAEQTEQTEVSAGLRSSFDASHAGLFATFSLVSQGLWRK